MKTILVTGAGGFIGKNLLAALEETEGVEVLPFRSGDSLEKLEAGLGRADFIFHLAGVNRAGKEEEYTKGNAGFTRFITRSLAEEGLRPALVFSSSIHACNSTPYGISKREAEEAVLEYSRNTGARVFIYRLPNVFGKWARPNYNSVAATFCHNIARGQEIKINDPDRVLRLVYVDDVVASFIERLNEGKNPERVSRPVIENEFSVTVRELADRLYRIRESREAGLVPDMLDKLDSRLYSTYLTYIERDELSKRPEMKADERGWLCEILKSKNSGQIFISESRPGVIRGNHYHSSKTEKFCVLRGNAVIRLRDIFEDGVKSYHVSGDTPEILDIPPGCTHSIENTGEGELLALFWAGEIFDTSRPDTYRRNVRT